MELGKYPFIEVRRDEREWWLRGKGGEPIFFFPFLSFAQVGILRDGSNRRGTGRSMGRSMGRGMEYGDPDHDDSSIPWSSSLHDVQVVKDMIFSSYWSLLLFSLPIGFLAGHFHWGPVSVFFFNFLAIIPLALLLGDVTEDLALRFGDVAGGLLNATFGNVVEMIISIAALRKGLYTVVSMSLLGSVFSNQLLVTGTCFLLGGLKYKIQSFSIAANKAYCSLLMIATICLCTPSMYSITVDSPTEAEEVLLLSRLTAIVMIGIYAAYLYFSLISHFDLFDATGAGGDNDDEEEEEETPQLSTPAALGLLGAISIIIAISSEYLTGSITDVSKSSGLSEHFIGVILLPIIGNACEHVTAVMVAMRNKMDLAMAVALGSSIQISIFALPFAVIAGWVLGEDFTLIFEPVTCLMFTLSVILTNVLTPDGQSTWLMGILLLCCYILFGFTYYVGNFT